LDIAGFTTSRIQGLAWVVESDEAEEFNLMLEEELAE